MMIGITSENFLTHEYISQILRSGMWVEHGSDIDTWLSECDEVPDQFYEKSLDEVKENPEFLKFFHHWLNLRFKWVIRLLAGDLDNNRTIRRAVYLTKAERESIAVGDCVDLGRYWTVSRSCVPYGTIPPKGKSLFVVSSPLVLDEVDMMETIRSRMDYSNGDYEMEIYVKGNVTISAIDYLPEAEGL